MAHLLTLNSVSVVDLEELEVLWEKSKRRKRYKHIVAFNIYFTELFLSQ